MLSHFVLTIHAPPQPPNILSEIVIGTYQRPTTKTALLSLINALVYRDFGENGNKNPFMI